MPASLAELRQNIHEVYRRGGGSRPDVLVVAFDGGKAVLKDHGACDPWFARLLGPVLTRRERRALECLREVPGIPELLGCPDSKSLLIEHVCAKPLEKAGPDTDWKTFFERLEQLLADMHAHGIAHCDMRSPFNTLIDANGFPVVVDFVASVSRGRSWNIFANWVFSRFARADRDATIKLKRSAAPQLVTESEHARDTHRSTPEQFARRVGARVRKLSRMLFTRDNG